LGINEVPSLIILDFKPEAKYKLFKEFNYKTSDDFLMGFKNKVLKK
jgi:hypothetical protein